MAFSREQLLAIVTPHVLRTLVRLQQDKGEQVTAEDLAQAKLTDEQQQALLQTRRLLPLEQADIYKINLLA